MINGWFHGSTVSALEFEALDAIRPSCVDGDGGGTYAPSALLSIGGLAVTLNPATLTLSAAAMAVSAPGTWTAAQTINANVALTGTLSGTITQSATVTRTGAETLSGSTAKTYHRRTDKSSPGATTSISVAADYYKFDNPTLACVVDVTRPTGEPAGLVIHVYVIGELSNAYTFKDDGTTMFSFVIGTPAKQSATLMWNGTAWEVAAISANATLAAGY